MGGCTAYTGIHKTCPLAPKDTQESTELQKYSCSHNWGAPEKLGVPFPQGKAYRSSNDKHYGANLDQNSDHSLACLVAQVKQQQQQPNLICKLKKKKKPERIKDRYWDGKVRNPNSNTKFAKAWSRTLHPCTNLPTLCSVPEKVPVIQAHWKCWSTCIMN